MKHAILIIFLLILNGCAPIGYVKAKPGIDGQAFETGYSDAMVAENRYHVKFQGNGNNNTTDVYKKFLRRAAEVAKEKGVAYFTVINGNAGNGGYPQAPWPNYEGDVLLSAKPAKGSLSVEDVLSKNSTD